MNIKTLLALVSLTLLSFTCQGQVIGNNEYNKTSMKTNQENTARKRRSSTIDIENLISARLEIEKEKGKLIAVLTFVNMSEQEVRVDKTKMYNCKNQMYINIKPNVHKNMQHKKKIAPFGAILI